MQHVEVRRHIDAPPGAVWDAYTDHVGWSGWAGVGRVRLAREGDPHPNGVGCIRVLGPGPLAAREEVLGFEPPERMTYRVVSGGLPMRDHLGEVRFEAEDAGTRVVWRCRFEPRIPGTGLLLQRLVTWIFRRALEGLARRRFPAR